MIKNSNSNNSQKTNLAWNNSPDGRKYVQPVSQDIDQGVRHDFPIPKNQKSSSVGMIGTILPGTMSGFAKDQNNAKLLKNMQGMRNVGNVGAAVALSPYTVDYAGTAGAPAYTSLGAVGQSFVNNGALSMGTDFVDQTVDSINCNCNKYDKNHILLSGLTGGAIGSWQTGMSKAAGVKEVDFLNLYKNIKARNGQGIALFGRATAAGLVSDKVIDEATK